MCVCSFFVSLQLFCNMSACLYLNFCCIYIDKYRKSGISQNGCHFVPLFFLFAIYFIDKRRYIREFKKFLVKIDFWRHLKHIIFFHLFNITYNTYNTYIVYMYTLYTIHSYNTHLHTYV